MDDDEIKNSDDVEEEEVEDEFDLGVKRKPKGGILGDDDSLDALADEEGGILPDDRFDDFESEEL